MPQPGPPLRSASVSSPYGFPLSHSHSPSSTPPSSSSSRTAAAAAAAAVAAAAVGRRRPSNLVLSLPISSSSSLSYTASTNPPSTAHPASSNAPPLFSPLDAAPRTASLFSQSHEYEYGYPSRSMDSTYEHGPVEVYAGTIYLYSEPSRATAAEYDVVINVAREVHNPFAADGGIASATSTPQPRVPASPALTPLSPASSSSSSARDDIPKASPPLSPPSSPRRENGPEYIYMPWDHTSELTGDLPYLTNIIARRVAEGKRVLVHCQCGMSRSASLVVAFVMRDKGWDLNRAYTWVKRKAPAIGPNMGLMYQLMEWGHILNNETVVLDRREGDEDLGVGGGAAAAAAALDVRS
ncbi:dual specificity phosphatase [Limtongia smithiae]|uniref:dual specificity phosphatase n=1 Tax=Limtongia smithiae TaxID=1125753 RepID=UPI0034CE00C5